MVPVELHGCPQQNYAAFTRVFERQRSEFFRIFPKGRQDTDLNCVPSKFGVKIRRISGKNRAETLKNVGLAHHNDPLAYNTALENRSSILFHLKKKEKAISRLFQ